VVRRLVRAATVGGVALLLAGLALSWSADGIVPADVESWLAQLAEALSFGFVGIAIVERVDGVEARVGLVMVVTGGCQAVTFATSSWIGRPGAAPAWVHWLDGWVWAPSVLAAVLVLPLLFPTGRAESGFGGVLRAALGLVGAGSAVAAYDALPGRAAPEALVVVVVALTAVGAVVGLVSLALRHRRGSSRVRGQVRWLAWALLLLLAAELAVPLFPGAVAQALLSTLPVLVPVAVGIAVLRYGLFDIDLLLTRTLVHLVLSAALLAVYVLLVLAVARGAAGDALTRPAFLAVLVVALLAVPVRDALRVLVTRALWGPAANRERALTSLVHRLASSPSLRDSPRVLAERIAEVLRAPIEVTAGDRPVAATGPMEEPVHAIEVRYSGRTVGAVRVGRRAAGPLAVREERLLEDVAAAVGPLLDSVLLTEELKIERARVLEVRDAERARLRRDLHDGLGPTLAGIALGVDAARNLVASAPERADVTLARLGELAGGATAEVRRVVDELGAHALQGRGLLEAIRAEVELEGVVPPVTVREQAVPALSRDAETTVLRIVLEAVTNVRRHAGAGRCEVFLGGESDQLVVLVDDDGRGLPERVPGTGVGLGSMRRRTEALGGRLVLGPSPLGGTRVCARIPVGGTP
jgi:signal transduction histidine kinase